MSDFTQPTYDTEPVAIYNDGGGLVSEYARAAWDYRLKGRKVKIVGQCRSACVLALAVPGTCVGPHAVVKAHYAYNQRTGEIDYQTTKAMMDILPTTIQERLEPNLTRNYNSRTTLYAKDLIALGVPACKSVPTWKPNSVSADYRPYLPQGFIRR